jgi:hypothetical protein
MYILKKKKTGEWIISTVDKNNVFRNEKGTQEVLSYFEIVFLPSQGKSGTIKSVLVGFRSENSENIDKKMGMWEEVVVESQQLGDYFVPQVVTLTEKPVLDEPEEIFGKYTYSEFEVNVPIDTSTFNIDWRKGTEIIDYYSQKSYVVGDSPADEAEATRAFLRYQGIESPPVISKRNNYIRVIVGVIGVLLVLWGIYSMFRKRKPPRNLPIIFFLLTVSLGFSNPGMAQENFYEEITNISNPSATLFAFDNGWWRLSESK